MLTVGGKNYSLAEETALKNLVKMAAKPGDTPQKVAAKLHISEQLVSALMGQRAPAPQVAPKQSADVAVAEPPKKRRGRPPGSKNKPKVASPPKAPEPEATPAPAARKTPPLSTFDADTIAVLKKRVAVGDSYEALAARLDVPVSVIVEAITKP